MRMDPEYLTQLLAALPTYTEATFVVLEGRTLHGTARDRPLLPGEEGRAAWTTAGLRRWTVEGFEWFISPGMFAPEGTISAVRDITVPDIEVGP